MDAKETQYIALVSEVGELAEAILYVEQHKNGKMRGKLNVSDAADALADIMWGLYRIADSYSIVLNTEYKNMLIRLEKRVKQEEFDPA
ncbi:MAG: MazG-like family protein [Patescibacteria group bacterium]|nr:MazG-like family protein [Patescibacteria group bacterium]